MILLIVLATLWGLLAIANSLTGRLEQASWQFGLCSVFILLIPVYERLHLS